MQLTTVIAKMGRNDARIIQRDAFLITLFAYGLVMIAVLRFAIPAIARALADAQLAFDLTPYYPLLVSGLVLHQIAGVLAGTIAGFLLIDERDHNTITALMVTPVPMQTYLLYKMLLPAIFGGLISLIGILMLGNLTTHLNIWHLLPLALINGLFSAMIALVLAGFSSNKVEGFATVKIIGSLMLVIFGAWFIPAPWEYLIAIYPPYWTMKAFWIIEAGGNGWPFMAGAVVTHLIALALLTRYFITTIYEG